MHVLIERRGCPLFGDKRRAERIVSWSLSKDPGTQLLIQRGTGISLEIVAREAAPRVYLYFNPNKLRDKLVEFGPQSLFNLVADGILIKAKGQNCSISLLSLPRKLACLWQGNIKDNPAHDNLLGMVELGEDAFRFYPRGECPARTELVGALAVVGRGQEKRPAKRLSPQSKRFLFKDALLNVLLMKDRPEGVGVKEDA